MFMIIWTLKSGDNLERKVWLLIKENYFGQSVSKGTKLECKDVKDGLLEIANYLFDLDQTVKCFNFRD